MRGVQIGVVDALLFLMWVLIVLPLMLVAQAVDAAASAFRGTKR